MCGISGILIKKSSKYFVNDKILTKMINSISHRGPDGRGFWISNDNKINTLDINNPNSAEDLLPSRMFYTLVKKFLPSS